MEHILWSILEKRLLPIFFCCVFGILSPAYGYAQQRQDFYIGYPGFNFEAGEAVQNNEGELIITGRLEGRDTELIDPSNPPAFLGKLPLYEPYMFVFKMNSMGDSLWLRVYPNSIEGMNIQQTSDKGWVATGFTLNPFRFSNADTVYQNPIIYKLREDGLIEWYKILTARYNSLPSSVIVVEDGYWVLSDYENPDKNVEQIRRLNTAKVRLTKLSLKGEILIDKLIEPSFDYLGNWGEDMLSDQDGNILIGGTAITSEENKKAWLAKLDTMGAMLWEKTWEIEREGLNIQKIIQVGPEEFVFAVISERFEAWLMKVNLNEEIIWKRGGKADIFGGAYCCMPEDNHIYFQVHKKMDEERESVVEEYDLQGNLLSTKEGFLGHHPVPMNHGLSEPMFFIFNQRINPSICQIEIIRFSKK